MLLNRKFIYIILSLQIIGILLAFFFSDTISADHIEHLRMSFLISEGYVPYRDFFEHHHPLIWYLFAPIIKLLPQNAILAFYVTRLAAFSASALMLYVIYRICAEFLQAKEPFIYFLTIIFSLYSLWYGVCVFKPDTFMRLFYFAGLYFFFRYIRDQKTKDLLYCGLCFTVAFLFLQTVVFSILPLILPLGYLIYKKPIILKQLSLAAIPSLLLIAVAVALLIISRTWQSYIALNWIFNLHLFAELFSDKLSVMWNFLPLPIAGGVAFAYLYKKKQLNIYWLITALLFVGELIQHCYFFAAFPHYLINLFIFSALPIAVCLPCIKEKVSLRYLYAFFISFLILNIITLINYNIANTLKSLKYINSHPEGKTLHIDYFSDQIYVPLLFYHTLAADTFSIYNKLFNEGATPDFEDYIKINDIEYLDFVLSEENKDMPLTKWIIKNCDQITKHIWKIRKD